MGCELWEQIAKYFVVFWQNVNFFIYRVGFLVYNDLVLNTTTL